MRLKSIEILGFKSFPDRTRLEFAEGITALVGPNGCGKSNIVDAIKWVLGEQSARTLRADQMDAVIFNGTEGRKPLNVAEIELQLSNDGRELLPGAAEIAVKRRLFRSGESEYFINGTAVRLREIREMFYDTGIGKSAYSIMEQGRIDQILSTRPEERRTVFEEAAGITKYRIKGQEAERKLEKTQENIRQVEGILGEVKRSHDSLKAQAEKTQAYRVLRERVFALELDIHLVRLKELTQERDRLEEKLTRQQAERGRLKGEIDSIRQAMEQGIDQVNTMESSLVENQKALYRIDLERSTKENQVKMLRERLAEIEREIAAVEERARALGKKLEASKDGHSQKNSQLAELAGLLADVEKNIEGFQTDIRQFEERIGGNEKMIAAAAEQAAGLEAEVERLRGDLRQITDDIVTQLDQKLKELGYSAAGRQAAEARIISALDALRIQLMGKVRLVEDYRLLGHLGEAELARLLSSTASTFQEILNRIEELAGHFADYRRWTPLFLEEFLAPEGIITRKREIDQRITATLAGIALKRGEADQLSVENRALSGKINEYQRTLEELRVNRARMYAQRTAFAGELERLAREIAEQDLALRESRGEADKARERHAAVEAQIAGLAEEARRLEAEDRRVKKELASLEGAISQKNKNLARTEQSLKSRGGELEQSQGHIEKLQVAQAELKTEIRGLHASFQEAHSRDLAEHEERMFEIRTPLKELRGELSGVREELKKLGQVNLMAPEEFAEVAQRYQFLAGQLEDLRKANADLVEITKEIRTESAEMFLATYNTIKKNFHMMFRRLFGGGRAELKLLDADNVLESGIEIYAQPPGKKLENINLLSGGEKTLTAIALLFSFFMVRPSPFCVLDEIDAALDEQNVLRFIHVLKEFAAGSQFLIVTHNKKTISSADTFLGITMEESGVSKIVSLRVENKVEEKTSA
ncbi:MAG: chromosome segregation protein SMC [Spirochaetes bacterium RBG_16_67_19]|nr:MAG: chromosome segregation protein SMC [Spirochaetes bacterium RBG_16_67_19]